MAVDMGSAVATLLLDTSNFNTSLQGAQSSLVSAGAAMSSAGATLTATVTKGFIDVSGSVVKTTMDFESAMSQVQATMGITADATTELNGAFVNTKDSLSDLAKELGASTKFSANEAAAAINNMAMAGYSVQEVYDALPTVLSLASAGALDLDYATQLVANGLNVMGLETKDATELADKLAVTASNAYGSVADFGEGLLKAGGQAQLANVSLTDTMTALGILGDNGISAAEGGTMFRNVLKNLYTPTTDAAKALKELGVQTVNSEGKLMDIQEVLQSLGGSLDNLTEEDRIKAMARIFDTRTIAGANALLDASGERWDELSDAIDEAGGAADRMAQTQLDNLSGQLTILKSSVEGLMLAFGEIMLPVVKSVAGAIQKVVDFLNGLDDSQKRLIMTIATVAAALGPILLIGGRLISTIGLAQSGLSSLGTSFGALGGKMALIAGIAAAIIAVFVRLYKTNDEFRESVQDAFEQLKDVFVKAKDAVVEVFEAIMPVVDELIQSLGGPLSAVIRTVVDLFSRAIDIILPIVTEIIGAIAGFVQSVTPSIQGIMDLITNIITKVGPLVQRMLETISPILSTIVGLITEIVSDIGPKINDMIMSILPVVTDIIDLLFSVIEELPIEEFFEALGELISTLLEIGGELISEVLEVLADILPVILDVLNELLPVISLVMQSIEPLLSILTSAIGLIASLLKGDWESAGDNFVGIFEGIFDSIKNVWDTLVAAFGAVSEILSPAFEAIGQFFTDIWNDIVGFFDGLGEDVSNFFDETLPEWIETVKEWFDKLPYEIGYFLGQAFQKIVNFGDSIKNWVAVDLPAHIENIVGWFKSLPGKIAEWLDVAVGKAKKWASDTWEAMVNGVSGIIKDIVDWFRGLPNKVKTEFDKTVSTLKKIDLKSVGSNILNSLWSGLKEKWESLSKWISDIGKKISNFMGSLSSGFSAGRDSVGAYATGLDYVPRTMDVTVHRGERILTQEENKKFNEGGSVQVTTYQDDSALLALGVKLDELLLAVNSIGDLKVVMDGKRLVGSIKREMNRQLADEYEFA